MFDCDPVQIELIFVNKRNEFLHAEDAHRSSLESLANFATLATCGDLIDALK